VTSRVATHSLDHAVTRQSLNLLLCHADDFAKLSAAANNVSTRKLNHPTDYLRAFTHINMPFSLRSL
jgi:hypothetical protein